MGVESELVPVGSAYYENLDNAGNFTSGGEGDSSRKPLLRLANLGYRSWVYPDLAVAKDQGKLVVRRIEGRG
jgi:hypothetical protein